MKEYKLAEMTADLRIMTIVLFVIPAAFLAAILAGFHILTGPLVFVAGIYAWVWFLFRPTSFAIGPEIVEVKWPLKRGFFTRSSVVSARILTRAELKQEVGWGARVGAGGLWGGFGWLWTTKRGIVQMYISRTDRFVWIERGAERPWMITPENPEEFVAALKA